MTARRTYLPWAVLTLAVVTPIFVAAQSPLLAWRDPIYIAAGFAGIVALVLLLVQPLLAIGYMPGLTLRHARAAHRWAGGILLLAVIAHVVGLWVTSPPDVIDALLLRSPTPFSIWGVIAMWAVFVIAGLAWIHGKRWLRPQVWQRAHLACAAIIAVSTVIHIILIEGTMGTISKGITALLVLAALVRVFTVRSKRFRKRQT